jgi:hypothetical protein
MPTAVSMLILPTAENRMAANSSSAARCLRAVCISGSVFLQFLTLFSVGISTSNAAPGPHASAPSATVVAGPNKNSHPAPANPRWSELPPMQQQALSPLAFEWDKLDHLRKKKWLELAEKFPKMKPDEQQRIQERMRDWARMTPEQRRVARESYVRAKKLNPEQKTAQWQKYQNLPEDQKKKLAADADKKKTVANLPRQTQKPAKLAVTPKPAAAASASAMSVPAVPASPAATPAVTPVPLQPLPRPADLP